MLQTQNEKSTILLVSILGSFEYFVKILVIQNPLLLIPKVIVRLSDHLKLFGRVPVLKNWENDWLIKLRKVCLICLEIKF